MESAYLDLQHAGAQSCIRHLQHRYWITCIRTVLRKIIHQCVTCHRYKASLATQLMANLPAARVRVSRPFAHTGVDCAGLFKIKSRTGRMAFVEENAYLVLFICMAIKTNHYEVV